jgi:tetratricopeptide (TPR) repeat protein
LRVDHPETVARAHVARGLDAFREGRLDAAEKEARAALNVDGKRPEAHFLVGLLALEKKDWRTAISAFGTVTLINPYDRAAWAHLARLFQRVGHFDRADVALSRSLGAGAVDPETADLIGTALAQFGRHREAETWHAKAFAAAPARADFAINVAASNLFLGRDGAAAAALDPFIEAGGVPQAEWLYSTLRRARSRARADRLMARAENAGAPGARAFLGYAAGKDYEDCALWDDAFAAFDLGARAKRASIEFDEQAEAAQFKALAETFTEEWAARAGAGYDDPAPIFIVGQPRTGTTLVERILAGHSMIEAAGELQQFGLCVRRLARAPLDAPIDRAAAAAGADPRALGEAYIRAAAPMRIGRSRFIDKLPRNYLHIPLIAKALPRARILHLTRDPMDVCFSSYKQLFADAYFHSYDQEEMARHYCRYAMLMDRWRAVLPGVIFDVPYERLVADIEGESQRIFDFLDRPLEPACLDFPSLDQPVATASAAQVREPAHARSVGRWRRYGAALDPMRRVLAAAGRLSPVVAVSEH